MRKAYLMGVVGCAVLLNPCLASAAEATYDLSGFLDTTYSAINDFDSAQRNRFNGLGELDIAGNTMGGKVGGLLDLNFFLNDANNNSTTVEQAFATWNITDRLGVDVGAFNSGLGWEKQDPTDLLTVTHGQLFDFFDAQTALYGNDVEGVLLHSSFQPPAGKAVNARLGFLNDLGDAQHHNSIMIQAGSDVVTGVNVQGSFVTQHLQAGNIADVNGTYRRGPLTVGLEFLTAEHEVDYGWGTTAHYDLTGTFGVTGRIDYLNREHTSVAVKNSVSYTVAGIWKAKDNLKLYVEYRGDDTGTWDNRFTLEAVAVFM